MPAWSGSVTRRNQSAYAIGSVLGYVHDPGSFALIKASPSYPAWIKLFDILLYDDIIDDGSVVFDFHSGSSRICDTLAMFINVADSDTHKSGV